MQKTVLNQIDELNRMSPDQLRKRWTDLLGTLPGRLGRSYLIRRLAYRIQDLGFGGLSEHVRKELRAIADGASPAGRARRRGKSRGQDLQPGTRLVREWHGQHYEVVVQEHGFLYSGQHYRSLSAIAKAITGAIWNGRRWFGVSPDR